MNIRAYGWTLTPFPKATRSLTPDAAGTRISVEPGRVLISPAIYVNAVVVRRAFPATDAGVIAGLEVLRGDQIRGEVVLAFDDHGIVAFGRCHTFPSSFRHVFLGPSRGQTLHLPTMIHEQARGYRGQREILRFADFVPDGGIKQSWAVTAAAGAA